MVLEPVVLEPVVLVKVVEWVCKGSGTWEGCRVMVPVPVATIDEVGAPDTVPT